VSESVTWAVTALSAIFFVVDPIAVVPIFLAMTPDSDDRQRAKMALRASVIAASVLVAFLFGGQAVFRLFGVTLYSFKVAGGVLLLLTALDQLRSHEPATRTSGDEIAAGRSKHDVTVVPLAMPLLAGPGSIATVIVFGGQATTPFRTAMLVAAILVTCTSAWLSLRAAGWINQRLGATGRAVFLRVSGLLLAAVGVQFMLSGIGEAYPFLTR
jgi:multiple antibiotic resistance protein